MSNNDRFSLSSDNEKPTSVLAMRLMEFKDGSSHHLRSAALLRLQYGQQPDTVKRVLLNDVDRLTHCTMGALGLIRAPDEELPHIGLHQDVMQSIQNVIIAAVQQFDEELIASNNQYVAQRVMLAIRSIAEPVITKAISDYPQLQEAAKADLHRQATHDISALVRDIVTTHGSRAEGKAEFNGKVRQMALAAIEVVDPIPGQPLVAHTLTDCIADIGAAFAHVVGKLARVKYHEALCANGLKVDDNLEPSKRYALQLTAASETAYHIQQSSADVFTRHLQHQQPHVRFVRYMRKPAS